MKRILITFFIVLLALNSCGNFGAGEPSVYVGGSFIDADGIQRACYWVNGQRRELNGTEVYNITVSGSNVYTAGIYMDAQGNERACYWINNRRHDLPGVDVSWGGGFLFGTISVDRRGNVYIVASDDVYGERAAYWVNGRRQNPPGIMTDAFAANGNVYISGSFMDGDVLKPCYWVNGNRRELPNTINSNPDWIGSLIRVADNKIYVSSIVAFFVDRTVDYHTYYWIDGIQQQRVINNSLTAFAVSEGDVYKAGRRSGIIYKNGEPYADMPRGVNIPPTNNYFAVSRGKIYIAGKNTYTACYWVDHERVDLNEDRAYESWANAIYVEQ